MQYRIELDIVCIFLVTWFTGRLIKAHDESSSQKLFLKLSYSVMATVALDFVCATISYGTGRFFYVLKNIFNISYLCILGFTTYYWLIYSTTFTKNKKIVTDNNKIKYAIPLIALIALLITTPWTKCIIWFDPVTAEQNFGEFRVLAFIVYFFYLIMATVQCLVAFFYDPETRAIFKHDAIGAIIVLPVMALIGCLVFDNFYSILPAISLVIGAISTDVQYNWLSADGLTGLNNKRQYLAYINSCISDPSENMDIYLMLIDIDYFKKINDKFGHAEGDKAITEVAALLKKACSGERGIFLARYGGDEFVYVVKARFEDEIVNLKKEIRRMINERNIYTTSKYQLSLSIGYSTFDKEKDTLETLTARVDDIMYKEKQEHHSILDIEK